LVRAFFCAAQGVGASSGREWQQPPESGINISLLKIVFRKQGA
jgi:hypothetical protein